ncbi:hypothetical protein M413DRAFT_13108 [Hebeloma cylindrosporum]|uniref:Cep57 centrosome microtubule-binding domain-containing protein n=1 Tax=Hebeloma cylindrosporum TaxID=76867 RepID=A0A0C3BMK4_HEBCY|nr:hypothetical protein M413DRAFT_13108 [Hebeloma cylindrosporum h7]
MSQDFNEHPNNRRPNIRPLQRGIGIVESPPRESASSSYRITLQTIIATSPPGSSSSVNAQNERRFADSVPWEEMDLVLSTLEETISKMQTKICALHNLNQQEKDGREALQEKCRGLEAAVRTLKDRLEESERDRDRAIQESGNLRHRTEDSLPVRSIQERTETEQEFPDDSVGQPHLAQHAPFVGGFWNPWDLEER